MELCISIILTSRAMSYSFYVLDTTLYFTVPVVVLVGGAAALTITAPPNPGTSVNDG